MSHQNHMKLHVIFDHYTLELTQTELISRLLIWEIDSDVNPRSVAWLRGHSKRQSLLWVRQVRANHSRPIIFSHYTTNNNLQRNFISRESLIGIHPVMIYPVMNFPKDR